MRLTEEEIAALACEPGRKDRLVFDDVVPGLALRVMASGTKTFLAQYTAGARRRRVPIGRWGAVTLKQARAAARGILGDVAKGQDVAQLRTEERTRAKAEAAAGKMTLAELLRQWDSLGLARRRPRHREEATRAIRTAYGGHLERRADALSRADAMAALDALQKAGKAAMAGRTLAYARACFTWAQRRGKVPENPFLGLPVASGTIARDRVLTMDELASIWRAAGELGWPFGPLHQLLILTAQRRDEVAGMRWSEIAAGGETWTIPKERAKNGRAHVVHLAPAARTILAELPRLAETELVFTTNRRTAVSGFSRAKEQLDAIAERLRVEDAARAGRPQPDPMPGWRIHDFRRTAVTWMATNGVAPHTADRILNHVQGTISGVAAVYQRAEFLAERKTALEAWAARVVGS